MATHKSAEKRSKQNEKRHQRNLSIKSGVKTAIKGVLAIIEDKDKEGSKAALAKATPSIQKAAAKGILHKKTASRRISRLTKKVNALNA